MNKKELAERQAHARSTRRRLIAGTVLVMIVAGVLALLAFRHPATIKAAAPRAETMSAPIAATPAAFTPTVANPAPAPARAPAGMTWIPGGEFSMGAQDAADMNDVGMKATLDSRPIHRTYVDGFFMDKTDVTNAEFAKFVKATGYVTIAERKPRAEDFPGAPPENLVAGSVVFAPPDHPVPLNDHFQWWTYIPKANWRHPSGPDSSLKAR